MPSNREVLEVLMSRPIGLFSILDEESKFPSANDSTFIAKMEAHLAEMSAGVYHRCVAWKWCNIWHSGRWQSCCCGFESFVT